MKNLTDKEIKYIVNLCTVKEDEKLTWQDIADICNDNLGFNYTESWYRKFYSGYVTKELLNTAFNEESTDQQVMDEFTEEPDPSMDLISETILELKKEKVKLSEERTQANAYIRRLAREDTIKEIAHDFAETMSAKKELKVDTSNIQTTGEKEAILEFSDLHYGIEIDSYWNKYNTEIAKQRMITLLGKTVANCVKEKVNVLHVLNLGDLISGRIHQSLRLQTRLDVISQIMQVSELMAEFLTYLSSFVKVKYYDCMDNHSRIEPNKKDSLELESLCRLTSWYLKERLKDNDNIEICANAISDDIITLQIFDHRIAAVHGHKDRLGNMIDNLCMMTKVHYDLICAAHYHHFSCDEKNEVLVINNGSIMGTDQFAENLRLCAKPSQNLIIVSKDNVAENLYRILL